MKIKKDIKFFPNTPDNTHCFQACLKMILKYYFPNEDYSWENLDRISAKTEGLWTWPMAGLVWLSDKGVEVKNIEAFDYKMFSKKGSDYLIEAFGKEVGESQVEHSDIRREVIIAKEFIKKIKIEKRIPEIKDIQVLIKNDYLVMCNVNGMILNNKKGYSGHFILIKAFNDSGFIVNDPGLPEFEDRFVFFELFDKAWSYPDKKARDIKAFKI